MQAMPGGAAVIGGALGGADSGDEDDGEARRRCQMAERSRQPRALLRARRVRQVVDHHQLHPCLTASPHNSHSCSYCYHIALFAGR